MKLNLCNFLQSNENKKIDSIWYIKDDEYIVKKETNSIYAFSGCLYHSVKWWAYIVVNGRTELLVYLENPKIKYGYDEWIRRKKYFREIYDLLESGV